MESLLADSNQSASIDDLLDGVRALILASTRLAEHRVQEWHGDDRPRVENTDRSIWYGQADEQPYEALGPSRYGIRDDVVINIVLCTRFALDRSNTDRRIIRKNLALAHIIKNAFTHKNLWTRYITTRDDTPPERHPASDQVSVAPMVPVTWPSSTRPKPGQGWIEKFMRFKVPMVLKVSLEFDGQPILPPQPGTVEQAISQGQ